MARQLKGEKAQAIANAKNALEELINCGKTVAASRAALQELVARDAEGEAMLAVFEKRFGLAIVPVEMVLP